MFETLCQLGVDVRESSHSYRMPFINRWNDVHGRTATYEYVRAKYYEDWFTNLEEYGAWSGTPHSALVDEADISMFIRCRSPGHYSLPVVDRFRETLSQKFNPTAVFWGAVPLRIMLWADGVVQSRNVLDSMQDGASVLHLAAFGYGFSYAYPRVVNEECQEEALSNWRALFRETLNICVDDLHRGNALHSLPLQYMNKAGESPFQILLGISCSIRSRGAASRRLNAMTRSWAADVESCGVPLEDYGRREKELFELYNYSASQPLDGSWRVTDFTYGPQPEDWGVCVGISTADSPILADFWEMVDPSPLAIPGAWIEDE
jgi:hypothetical protein